MASYFAFLIVGYCVTVSIELPILWFGLDKVHSRQEKFFAAFWLTACTYPVVVLAFPQLIDPGANRGTYLLFAESFAIIAECVLFRWVATKNANHLRDSVVITVANLTSFLLGELTYYLVTEALRS